MKIKKYPSVVYEVPGFQITATMKGPVCEAKNAGASEWEPAELGRHGGALLKAYHALMQATDCEVPVKAPIVYSTIDLPTDGPPDDDD